MPMSFLRHWEIYRNSLKGGLATAPHCDEFPASYSSASCSPAELASPSLASKSMIASVLVGNDFSANGTVSLVSVFHRTGALQKVPCPLSCPASYRRSSPSAPALPGTAIGPPKKTHCSSHENAQEEGTCVLSPPFAKGPVSPFLPCKLPPILTLCPCSARFSSAPVAGTGHMPTHGY